MPSVGVGFSADDLFPRSLHIVFWTYDRKSKLLHMPDGSNVEHTFHRLLELIHKDHYDTHQTPSVAI